MRRMSGRLAICGLTCRVFTALEATVPRLPGLDAQRLASADGEMTARPRLGL